MPFRCTSVNCMRFLVVVLTRTSIVWLSPVPVCRRRNKAPGRAPSLPLRVQCPIEWIPSTITQSSPSNPDVLVPCSIYMFLAHAVESAWKPNLSHLHSKLSLLFSFLATALPPSDWSRTANLLPSS